MKLPSQKRAKKLNHLNYLLKFTDWSQDGKLISFNMFQSFKWQLMLPCQKSENQISKLKMGSLFLQNPKYLRLLDYRLGLWWLRSIAVSQSYDAT